MVLCCRVAPLQKAGIVALVKNRTTDMTLAIGDGKYYSVDIIPKSLFYASKFIYQYPLHFMLTLGTRFCNIFRCK